jgi:hypothetical protein
MFGFLQTIGEKIVTGIIAVGIVLGGFLGMTTPQVNPPSEQDLGATVPIVVAVFETSLAAGITSTATEMTLVSGTTSDSTTLSGVYGFVIDEGTSSEEFVLATCADTVCSSMTRGVSTITGNTSVTALKHSHAKGASVKISDHPQLAIVSRIVNGDEDFPNSLEFDAVLTYTSSGMADVFTTNDIVNKDYVDSSVLAGGANADLTTKGISEMATLGEINSFTTSGGTSANLFVNPAYLGNSNYGHYLPTADEKNALDGTGTPSATNKYVTSDDTTFTETKTFFDATNITGAEAEDLTDAGTSTAHKHIPLVASGYATYNSTGTNQITTGFTSSLIKVTAIYDATDNVSISIGTATGTSAEQSISVEVDGDITNASTITNLVDTSSGPVFTADISAIDGTTFTYNVSAATVTAKIIWEAWGY